MKTAGDHISFGFHKGRSAKDACEQIFCILARSRYATRAPIRILYKA